ncbi:MAG TPA: hypothetical protein VEF06_11495 [Bryobacteraceae bacterium]|nr:hypothetical protein [Bryobacteraceae bacterium]
MRSSFLLWVLAAPLVAQNGHPDFQGIWNSGTATPVERPDKLKGKAFFTPQEAAAYEREITTRNSENVRTGNQGAVGTYNEVFWEFGTKVSKTLRTSMIYDPPDGKIPPLTTAAAIEAHRRQEAIRHPAGPEDTRIADQCLMFTTGGPPMIPYNYNSDYQIIQTADEVAIYVEMPHDTRIISLTRTEHLPASVRLWYGDSIGHWEGNTLVVDTTNFLDQTSFYGSDRNMHVVERFSLFDKDTILYQFDVDDPTAFTKPIKGEYTMSRASGPIYEYACHEGNYALPGVLRGARAEEAAAAEAAKKAGEGVSQ